MMKALTDPFSLRFFDAVHNLRKALAIGITTVRDAGGADLGVKTAVEQGSIDGPRMQISLTMLSQTGGHGDPWMPCGAEVPMFGIAYPGMPSNIVDGPEEMRAKVRELVRAGADVIKVATTGGVLSPRDDPRHGHFRDDELEMLVSEASAAGLWVMAHAQGTPGIKAAIRAGIRSIDHGVYLDDQAIEMMLERETFFVPTLVAPTGVLTAAERGVPIPENMVQKAREVIDAHRDSFKRAAAAGVKIAMGTDSAVTPHGENLKELALMADGGMEPIDVLVSSTSRAAELMGLQEELGTIEPGKRADLVVVAGDPTDLVNLSDRVTAVYKDGRRAIERTEATA
jgi:imidazolonepropionase-like amidohydrolase